MSAKPPKDVSDAIRLAGPEAVLAALEAAPDYAEAQPEAGNPDAPRRPLADILADLRDLFARFLFFPSPSCAPVLALWTAHTYALDAFTFTPYLAINSPVKRCGKTTLLDLLGFVVHQPLTAASISPAALFRVVEAERPTLLLDETDSIFASGPLSETAEALRGVLNSGFQANGRVTRCVGPNHDVAHFSTFCPKALAGIGTLPDTVRDRSISLPLARKPKNWQAPRLRRRDIEPTTEALRRQLVTWADGESVELLRVAQPALPDPLNDRQCDIAEPLLAIADMAGGDWPAVARRALCELCAGTAGDEGGLGAMLLRGHTGRIQGQRRGQAADGRDHRGAGEYRGRWTVGALVGKGPQSGQHEGAGCFPRQAPQGVRHHPRLNPLFGWLDP